MTEVDRMARCSVQRAVGVLGDRWTLLILREAFFGRTRFTEFSANLGVAPDVLSNRLTRLLDEGLLRREAYRDKGARQRERYQLTADGRDLYPLIAALGNWGQVARPVRGGTAPAFASTATGERVRLVFLSDSGEVIAPGAVVVQRGDPAEPD